MTIKPSEIAELCAAGRYPAAAAAAEAAGELEWAAEIYERIWEFASAARCARQAGILDRALRDAIDAGDEVLVSEIAEELSSRGEPGRRQAMEVFALRRRFAAAGRVAETLGELDLAIDYFQRGQLDLDAARLLEARGKDREAGRLLERVVAQEDDAEITATAHLALGRLLARRLQHDEATRHLQEATRHPATRDQAYPALVVELAALGLRDAARDALAAARQHAPDLPATVDRLIAERRASEPSHPAPCEAEIVAGRYRLDGLLGSGGSGRVYLARDEVTGNEVAIKLFSTGPARGQQKYERFVREARVASALRHPNLVEVFDFSAEQGFSVMEYMVGGSLVERIAAGLTQPAVRRMALDILAGLELAHQRGIIHRDVKPANIFFDGRGTAKLGDFGVAHLLDLGQTQTGGLIGTLAYMAPEQITGARLSITADLYSFGVVLFEALTGRLPFLGPDFVAQHLGEPAPPPSLVTPELAPAWDGIAASLLAKDPDGRYDSISAVRHDIVAADLGDAATPRPLILPRAVPATPRPPEPAVVAAQAEPSPRYQFETPLGRTAISSLSRAVDTALDRSVMIEQYDDGAVDETIERRLYSLARGGGPFLQRALSYDRKAGRVVYEAPAGIPIAEAFRDGLPPRTAVRLLKRLARAVTPLHQVDSAHGAIGPTVVVVDDAGNPTILTCGLPPPHEPVSPAGDVAAIIDLITGLLGGSPGGDLDSLLAGLAAHLPPARRRALVSQPAIDGESLYAAADTIEIVLLVTIMGPNPVESKS